MKPSTFIIFFIVVLLTDKIHAVVFNVFGNLQDRNEFACNTLVILQCIVNPSNNPVLWRVGNPITPSTAVAAQCSGNSCSINPAVSNIYDFSYDENSGNTNMTIKNVTLAEDGKKYECDDDSTFSIFDSVVQVPPVKETTQISNETVAEVAKTTIITCSTGCVTNRTAELVTFRWNTIDVNGRVSIYKDATPPSSSDDSPCQINSDCVTNGSVALSDNFTITEDEKAPKVYFQVQILLAGDLLFSVQTTTTFQPKSGQEQQTTNPFTNHTIAGTTSAAVSFSTEVGSNATTENVIFNTTANSTVYPSDEKFEMTYIFVITIIVVVVLGAVVVVLFLFVLRRRKKNKRKRDKSDSNSKHTSIRFKKEQQNEKYCVNLTRSYEHHMQRH